MPSRYIAVPAESLRARFNEAGFKLLDAPSGQEETYERRHHRHTDFAVKIYSSIPRGGETVRACDTDAIRICAIRYVAWSRFTSLKCDLRAIGLKAARVYRVGTVEGVLERTITKAREMYVFLNKAIGGYKQLEALTKEKA